MALLVVASPRARRPWRRRIARPWCSRCSAPFASVRFDGRGRPRATRRSLLRVKERHGRRARGRGLGGRSRVVRGCGGSRGGHAAHLPVLGPPQPGVRRRVVVAGERRRLEAALGSLVRTAPCRGCTRPACRHSRGCSWAAWARRSTAGGARPKRCWPTRGRKVTGALPGVHDRRKIRRGAPDAEVGTVEAVVNGGAAHEERGPPRRDRGRHAGEPRRCRSGASHLSWVRHRDLGRAVDL